MRGSDVRKVVLLLIVLGQGFLLAQDRTATGVSDQQKNETGPKTLEELQQRLRQVLEQTKTPGLGVALVTKDNVLWVAGIGKADVVAGTDITPETLFRVGSTSKSFVSLAVLKLQEQGKLNLNDHLRDLAPEVEFTNPWEATDPVRLVHLLEHTAGFDDIHLREYATDDPLIRLRDALAFNPKSRTVRWKPGRYFSYSNSGPAVAAYVVENVSGRQYEDFVREQFFDALEMEMASFFPTDAVRQRLAKSYRADGVTEVPYSHMIMRPSGAINATPRAMTHLVQMLLNRGTHKGSILLQPESIVRMETPTTTLAAQRGFRAGYGLGNFTTSESGFLFHGHNGAIDGFMASYGYLPEQGVGYVFAINASNGRAYREIGSLIRSYLTRGLKRPVLPATAISQERLQRFTGYYEPVTPRLEMSRFLTRLLGIERMEIQGGKLYAKPLFGKPLDLLVAGEREFRENADPVATLIFLEGESGERLLQGASQRITGTYRRVPSWWVWLQWLLLLFSLGLMVSSVLFALVWIPRKMLKRMQKVSYLSVRAIPLAAVVFLALAFGLVAFTTDDPINRLGKRTLWSIGFWALTWLFAISAILGLVQALRARAPDVRRAVRIHALLVSLANTLVMLYLAYWGIIGLRTWS